MINELNQRTREIFRHVVNAYMEQGAPVGSKTLAGISGLNISPASIRNALSDLEHKGLLYAPHVSAGRIPTQQGLRLYVDGLMEIGNLDESERARIEAECAGAGDNPDQIYERASSLLSGLSDCMGLVVAPKTDRPLHQIQFVLLEPGRALVILVSKDGLVENRIMDVPQDLDESTMQQTANFLNDKIAGRTIREAYSLVTEELQDKRARLDALAADLAARGIAMPQNSAGAEGHLIVRGQSRLLDDVKAVSDLEHARQLFAALEEQETMMNLLEAAGDGEGVQIYIGTENRVFNYSGWSMLISPCKNTQEQIVGAIGVIGPTRLNYGRLIPVIDYTSQVMASLTGEYT
jgi:heat-inducible transcriptional repressor